MPISKMPWVIVQFFEEEYSPIEAVPVSWVVDDHCFWPNECTAVSKAIKKQETPSASWSKYKIRIIGKTYDDYLTARYQLKRAQETSDLSEVEHSGIRKRIPKQVSSSESDEDEDTYLPPFPTYGKNPKKDKKKEDCTATKNGAVAFHKNSQHMPTHSDLQQNVGMVDIVNTPIIIEGVNIPAVKNNAQGQPSLQTSEFERQVLRQLNLLHIKLDQQRDDVNTLLALLKEKNTPNIDVQRTAISSFLNVNSFPISDIENFYNIEEKLLEKENQITLENELIFIGGNNLKHFVKRVMERLMTFGFATNFSYDGRKGKKPFRTSKLAECVKNSAFQSDFKAFENEIEKVLREYFRRSKERSEAKKRINNNNLEF